MISLGMEALTGAVLARSGKRKGDEIVFQCPYPERHKNGDKHPSAGYNAAKEVWHCVACGAGGSARELATLLGLQVNNPSMPLDGPPRGILPFYSGAKLVAWWIYKDKINQEVGVVARYEKEGERKQVVPFFRKDGASWVTGGPKTPSSLYGLDWIASQPSAPVIVVEGEKCAAALQKHVIVGVTSQGGSSNASKSDWTPLAGRDVVIWPDNDEPGQKYAWEVEQLCRSVGCKSVKILDVSTLSLPAGGDVADWLELNPDAGRDELLAILAVEGGKKYGLIKLGFREIMKMEIPPREVLITPWLKQKDLTMLYAWRGAGKSYTAMSMALSLISGVDFLGWDIPEPRNVLYVDGEMPLALLKLRLSELSIGMEANMRKAGKPWNPQGTLDFIAADVQDSGIPRLTTTRGQQFIEEYLADFEYDVIFFDNIATLCGGDDENSAEAWLPMQEWLLRLRRKNYTVQMLHHAGKGGKQRGTSAREDILDTVIALDRPHDYQNTDCARFIWNFQKSRSLDASSIVPIEAQLIAHPDEPNGLIWSYEDCENYLATSVIRMYSEENMNLGDIAKVLKKDESTIYRVLKRNNIPIRGRHGKR